MQLRGLAGRGILIVVGIGCQIGGTGVDIIHGCRLIGFEIILVEGGPVHLAEVPIENH